MPRLSNEKINEIRQSVDIVDVIGNYLPLERRGRNYLARCPFHALNSMVLILDLHVVFLHKM